MGKFATAMTNLAALAVIGVTYNYDVNTLPEKLSRAALPVLLVIPGGQDGDFEMQSPSGSGALVTYAVTHLLLYAPLGSGRRAAGVMPGLVDVLDNYATAIRGNPKLTGALFEPTRYTVFVSPVQWSGIPYYGARIAHQMVIQT